MIPRMSIPIPIIFPAFSISAVLSDQPEAVASVVASEEEAYRLVPCQPLVSHPDLYSSFQVREA